jgi:proteasome lid subunit RPN8/RPN11
MRQKIIDAIMAHAAAEYPRECCGVVAQKSRVSVISLPQSGSRAD